MCYKIRLIGQIESILNDDIKNIGRNKVSVQVSQAANKFLNNPFLDLAKYKAIIPTYNINKKDLAKEVPIDFSMEELHAVALSWKRVAWIVRLLVRGFLLWFE